MESMFEMTVSYRRSLAGADEAAHGAVLDPEAGDIAVGLLVAAELGRELRQGVATARVPPIGYQTPSAACIWAMAQSTAGEP